MQQVLHLDLLGGYRAYMSGSEKPIDFPTKKSALLLPPIVLERPAPTRDRLAALLWSNRQEQQGRGSLRQAIFTLRAVLRDADAPEPVALQDRIEIPDDFVTCDAVLFQNLASQRGAAAMEQARALYKGPFLGTVRLPDPAYGDWAADQRARLSQLAEGVGIRLGTAYKEETRYQDAVEVMNWVLAMDPLREDVHRELMELHVLSGNRTMALRQFQQCQELLDRELAVAPDGDTLELHRAIVENRLTAAASPGKAAPPPPAPATAARAAELEPVKPKPKAATGTFDVKLPMLAVLPFELISDAPDMDQLGQGLFEDITTDLPRFHQVQAKTRNSALSALQSGTPRSSVGSTIGADYVVDGAIRSAGGRVRVNVQLVEVETGFQIWSDRYTVDFDDPFDTQDYLAQHILSGVTTQLKTEMLAQAQRKSPEELTPYDCWLIGFALLQTGVESDTLQARNLFQVAVDRDPFYARGYCGLSLSYFNEWGHHAWVEWAAAIEKAFKYAEQAVKLDETDHVGQCLLGRIHLYRREFDRGQRYLERSYTLNPYGSDMLATAALSWCFLGDHDRAQELAEKAIELHPSPPEWYYGGLAVTLFMKDEIEAAQAMREKAPHAYFDTLFFLAAGHAFAGRMDRAQEYAASFMERFQALVLGGRPPKPGEANDWIRHVNPFRREQDIARIEKAMSMVGLNEG